LCFPVLRKIQKKQERTAWWTGLKQGAFYASLFKGWTFAQIEIFLHQLKLGYREFRFKTPFMQFG
jgi:hypothetical protein